MEKGKGDSSSRSATLERPRWNNCWSVMVVVKDGRKIAPVALDTTLLSPCRRRRRSLGYTSMSLRSVRFPLRHLAWRVNDTLSVEVDPR